MEEAAGQWVAPGVIGPGIGRRIRFVWNVWRKPAGKVKEAMKFPTFEVITMKKKCTVSDCRKVFRYNPEERVICPHCGKEYPGLRKNENRLYCNLDGIRFDVTGIKERKDQILTRPIMTVRFLRKQAGMETIPLATIREFVRYVGETGRCPVKAYSKSVNEGRIRVVKSVRVW